MMRDRRLCPHCLHEIEPRPYTMGQRDGQVCSTAQAAWLLCLLIVVCLVFAVVLG